MLAGGQDRLLHISCHQYCVTCVKGARMKGSMGPLEGVRLAAGSDQADTG